MKLLFTKGPSYFSRVALLGLLAVALLLVGRYTPWLDPVRSKLDVLTVPFYWVTDIPHRVSNWLGVNWVSRQELQEENRLLRNQIRVQDSRLQQMASLVAENLRLRQLMNSSEIVQDRVLIAELIGVSPDPLVHKVIVNKGSNDGVYVGQPLLDAFGLMGQVVSVTAYTAQVLLITDNSHAIPVQVTRNNVRTVAEGVGDLYQLRLRYVSSTMDIKKGDILVSSGLGGRFPVGYPVAQVDEITYDQGEPFATVIARPAAQLDRSRHVLLVFSEQENSFIQSVQ
ncbi:MAG: rod shape-determining protein MreC [Cellvibrionaceae bacterium]